MLGQALDSPGLTTATRITVGVADLAVSENVAAVITTYALGSCIGLVLYDPRRRVGGMLHYKLPQSNISPTKARVSPATFADTGIPLLFRRMYELGSVKRDLVVRAAGGAAIYDDHGIFQIGKRNLIILQRLMAKNGVAVRATDVGGHRSRTIKLDVASGELTVISGGTETLL